MSGKGGEGGRRGEVGRGKQEGGEVSRRGKFWGKERG